MAEKPQPAEVDLIVNKHVYFQNQSAFDSFLTRGYRLLVVNDRNVIVLIKGETPRSRQEQTDADARFDAMDAEARVGHQQPIKRLALLSSYFDL